MLSKPNGTVRKSGSACCIGTGHDPHSNPTVKSLIQKPCRICTGCSSRAGRKLQPSYCPRSIPKANLPCGAPSLPGLCAKQAKARPMSKNSGARRCSASTTRRTWRVRKQAVTVEAPSGLTANGRHAAIEKAAGLTVYEPDDGVVHFARWRPFDQNCHFPLCGLGASARGGRGW